MNLIATVITAITVIALAGGDLQIIVHHDGQVWDIYAGCFSGGVWARHNGVPDWHPDAWIRRIAERECTAKERRQ